MSQETRVFMKELVKLDDDLEISFINKAVTNPTAGPTSFIAGSTIMLSFGSFGSCFLTTSLYCSPVEIKISFQVKSG